MQESVEEDRTLRDRNRSTTETPESIATLHLKAPTPHRSKALDPGRETTISGFEMGAQRQSGPVRTARVAEPYG